MYVGTVCAGDRGLSAAGSGTEHATSFGVRFDRLFHLAGGEYQYVFRCLALPESGRSLGGGPSGQMELLVSVGYHDIYHRGESKTHQGSDSYSTTVMDNG